MTKKEPLKSDRVERSKADPDKAGEKAQTSTDEARPGAGASQDDRNRWAKGNLERRLADHGMNSEQAHQRAAQVARETDRKRSG